MKNLLFAFAFAGLFMAQGCDTSQRTENMTSVDKVDPGQRNSSNVNDTDLSGADRATSTDNMAYVCPMRCEGSASMNPGKCPVCNMDLVKNKNYTGTATDAHGTHSPGVQGANTHGNQVPNHDQSGHQSRGTDDNLEGQPTR